MLRNSSTNYGTIIRLLHWGMAILVIVLIAAVELHESFPKGSSLRNAMMSTHFQFGLLVLLLMLPRLAVVFTDKVPPIQPEPPRWQDLSAKLIHFALYASMIALPIIGIWMQQAGDRTVSLLGMQLPAMFGVDKEFAKELKEVHETVGNVMIGLIVLHIAAAFWHHIRQRDNTLLRMLPPRG